MDDCELLKTCGFFIKYGEKLNLSCHVFVNSFCRGEKKDECKRKIYRQINGFPPEDEMMPNGMIYSINNGAR